MSEGLNKCYLQGNLTADPELKELDGGSAVLKIRLATNERYKGKDDKWTEKVEYHNATIWGAARAEALDKILRKGSAVLIEGSLRTREWEKEGQKHYTTEVNVDKLILCGGGPRHDDDRGDDRNGNRDDRDRGSSSRSRDDDRDRDRGGRGRDDRGDRDRDRGGSRGRDDRGFE